MHHYLILQAQSIGLAGEPFAVGYALVNEENALLEEGYLSCSPHHASGLDEDRKWVGENVEPLLSQEKMNCENPADLCERVWHIWLEFKEKYSQLYCASYIGFPIMMNLFANAIKPKAEERENQAPYPFFEIDTAFFFTNYTVSPMNYPRLEQENPGRHPLSDAKYYARLFTLAREKIKNVGLSFEGTLNRPLCGLDTKSRGLWGGSFYFGSVLFNSENNEEKTTHRSWRQVTQVEGNPRDDIWRQPYENTLPQGNDCKTTEDFGNAIWDWLKYAKKSNPLFIAWCPFPVDYRAVFEAVKISPNKRQLKCIYPIHDAATALYLAGKDPVGDYPRRETEEKHGDPRGSARLAIRLFLNKV